MTWYSGYLQGFQEGYLKALEQQMQIAQQQNIVTQVESKLKRKYKRSVEGERKRAEAVRKFFAKQKKK